MSEYSSVEKPFLDKLKQIGWTVIDHGNNGIPQDPTISKRTNFDDWAIKSIFSQKIKDFNSWITDDQINQCWDKIITQAGKLLEVNESTFLMLRKGITLEGRNEVTGEENPTVQLVAFGKDYAENDFTAINQFRVNTPGTAKPFIIPDIVCFVNGLPWIVIECKDEDVAEPMSEAFDQIQRYANLRNDEDDEYAEVEGKEQLYYPNLFSVITHGVEARFGTISSDFDFYYNWRDIFPEEYRTIEIGDDEQSVRQEVIIRGMFNKEILIDLLQNFTLFMTLKAGNKIKALARYNQYRATGKMIERLKAGKTWQERSGVIWHTQGSGKSLTMVFLVKKMRTTFELKGFKILMVVDRLDLENQLLTNAQLTGEAPDKPITTKSRGANDNSPILADLADDTPDLNLIMIHKFGKNQQYTPEYLAKHDLVPVYEKLELINSSDKILILIDEAHRTQSGDMNAALFQAFPNASRIGFTGTPLMKKSDRLSTSQRFGQLDECYIDTYKMNDAVSDHETVDIKYIGKVVTSDLDNSEGFAQAFEEIFNARTEKERLEIMKRYGGMEAYLESNERVKRISEDLFAHYVTEILPNGFKAMVVSSSITAACRYSVQLRNLIKKQLEIEQTKPKEDQDEYVINRLSKLQVRTVISDPGNNAEAYILKEHRDGRSKDILESFCKNYSDEIGKEDSNIGILCVCDRLLTGFDAPILQVMYLDKNLREQNLMQAIARVNRTKKHKDHGIVVDYFGVLKNLQKALGIYTDQDKEEAKIELDDFEKYFSNIAKEKPELELRYNALIQFFSDTLKIANAAGYFDQTLSSEDDTKFVNEVLEAMKEVKWRAKFDTLFGRYLSQIDLLFSEVDVQQAHWIRAKRLGYLVYRIGYFFHDKTMDLKYASRKVRQLIDKYVKSTGVDTKFSQMEIMSDDFIKIKGDYQNPKSQASAIEYALRYHIKVTLGSKDPGLYQKFNTRIDAILKTYKDNWDMQISEFEKLQKEFVSGEKKDPRFVSVQPAFHNILTTFAPEAEGNKEIDDKLAKLVTDKIWPKVCEYIKIDYLWKKPAEVQRLQDAMAMELRISGINELHNQNKEIALQFQNLCKNNYNELLKFVKNKVAN
ncbi:type I restriction endonuclease subunit R [Fibrobacter sp.]|uniref:type I restriction endonuclease subunit R n=1 Tax=Fibrobacter sp. TaxID=35828 RepID=UPI0038909063